MLVNALGWTHHQVCRYGWRICGDTPESLVVTAGTGRTGDAPAETLTRLPGVEAPTRLIYDTP
jgi:hypothetical protein